MDGHTLYGSMPRRTGDVPEASCVWCGSPTDLRFEPRGMPHLGPLPLHMSCSVRVIRAYERFLAGHVLSEQDTSRLRRLAASQ